jgi:hypothetical protein
MHLSDIEDVGKGLILRSLPDVKGQSGGEDEGKNLGEIHLDDDNPLVDFAHSIEFHSFW